MKMNLRSKSETDVFFDKEYLNCIQENLNKFKPPKTKLEYNKRKHNSSNCKNVPPQSNNKNIILVKKVVSETSKTQEQETLSSLKESELKIKYQSSGVQISINPPSPLIASNEAYTGEKLKTQIENIFKFKLEFDKMYLESVIFQRKAFVNQILEIKLLKLKKFKESYLTKIMHESIYESPLSMTRFVDINDNNESIDTTSALKDNFEKFERILELIIRMSPEELFREVKSLILNEFDKTTLEIQNYLEKHKNKAGMDIFTWLSQSILFILSSITFKLDVYSITVNCLIEKINKNFLEFLERYNNYIAEEQETDIIKNKFVKKSLNIVHKFIKLKKHFIKDFCQNNNTEFRYCENVNNDLNDKFRFSFNKFNSFGRYLFNNCLTLINLDNNFSNCRKKISSSRLRLENMSKVELKNFICKIRKKGVNINTHIYNSNYNNTPPFNKTNSYYNSIDLKKSNSGNVFFPAHKYDKIIQSQNQNSPMKNQTRGKNNLDVYFKLYFTFKLTNWKYTSIQSENFPKKNEICRICELSFPINDFVLHISFCKDQRVYNQKITILNKELVNSFEDLKIYETKLKNDEQTKVKDIFFSPKSEFNVRFKTQMIERTPVFVGRNKNKKRDNELLDILSNALEKEKVMNFADYELKPYKLSQLVSLIHFTVLILNQNKNCNSFSEDLDHIFSKLFNVLMKKMYIVENILTLQDYRLRAKMKIKNFYFKKQISLLKTPYQEGRDSYGLGRIVKKSSNKIINKEFSPNKKTSNNSKKFLFVLDNTQTKFKKISSNNNRGSPKYNRDKNLALNSVKNYENKINKDSSNITEMLFPFKKENLVVNNSAKQITKNIPLNGLNRYLGNKNNEAKSGEMYSNSSSYNQLENKKQQINIIPNGNVKNSPRNNIVKEVGKELKQITKNIEGLNKNKLAIDNDLLFTRVIPKNKKSSNKRFFGRESVSHNFDETTGSLGNTQNILISSNNIPNPFGQDTNTSIKDGYNTLSKSPILGRNSNRFECSSPLTPMSHPMNDNLMNVTNDDLGMTILNSPCVINYKPEIYSKKPVLKSKFQNSNYNVNNFATPDKVSENNHIIEKASSKETDHNFINQINSPLNIPNINEIKNLNNFVKSPRSPYLELYVSNTKEEKNSDEDSSMDSDTDLGAKIISYKVKFDRSDDDMENFHKNISRMDYVDEGGDILEMEIEENNDDSQFDDILDLMEEIQISDPCENNKDMSIIRDESELDSSILSAEEKFGVNSLNQQMKISDFKYIKKIGKGGYGRVDLYKKITTGDVYAIKSVDIKKMKLNNVAALLNKETVVFNEIYSDYVVKCFWMFSDSSNYYYVMEYVPGGNLLNFLNKYNLKNETIQLIVAEVILSLEYLHSKNIIHRDIKPENILISYESHFKLTDFGISEVGNRNNKYVISNFSLDEEELKLQTNTILGTEHYIAPEILKDDTITFQVDYWSLGVLIFELYTSSLPFMNDDISKISDNILNNKINWQPFDKLEKLERFLPTILKNAKDLINKFLVIEPDLRWGYGNIKEVKNHPFFANFDWKNIKNISDPLVKKHVFEQIKEINKKGSPKEDSIISVNQSKKEDNNEGIKNNFSISDPNQTVINYKQPKNFLSSERVDNLYLICQDVIKKNLKQKTLNVDYGDEKFTDMMNDLMD